MDIINKITQIEQTFKKIDEFIQSINYLKEMNDNPKK
jgi:hypothetical protein